MHQWPGNKLKSILELKKPHPALGAALDPAQAYKIKALIYLQNFLFASAVNRLECKSSL